MDEAGYRYTRHHQPASCMQAACPCRASRNVLTRRVAAALVLGNKTYPRPCSGYASDTEKEFCFCHYHPGTGTFVWPFSSGNNKCRQAIECKYTVPTLTCCPPTTMADDVEFNGQTRCLDQPSGFECSTSGKRYLANSNTALTLSTHTAMNNHHIGVNCIGMSNLHPAVLFFAAAKLQMPVRTGVLLRALMEC
jgi:hypothetical protein